MVSMLGIQYSGEREARLRREHRDALQRFQVLSQAASFRKDERSLLLQHLEPLEHEERRGLRQDADAVGGAHLVELRDPYRPPDQVAQTDAGEAELRHG